jgi:hypothetical protein
MPAAPPMLTPAATLRVVRETRVLDEGRQRRADIVGELLALLERAVMHGVRSARAERLRRHLLADRLPLADLERIERRARGWLRRRRGDAPEP